MCGVAGAINTAKSESLLSAVEKMTAALIHRGPDDGGVTSLEFRGSSTDVEKESNTHNDQANETGEIVLGARRLAVLDLSRAGHQPMQDAEAGLTIVYNGETYNFRELRDEIGDEFGPWISNTDTEVVLRAYRKWGLRAFENMRGMFAVAIWDSRRRELILARDPFGIKPLYYCDLFPNSSSPNRNARCSFLFASEVRALLASEMVPRKLNMDGVASYLNFGSVEAPLTIVEGIRSLMPGHSLRVRVYDGHLEIDDHATADIQTLTSNRVVEDYLPHSRKDAVAMLRQKLEDSVRSHLASDVPLGVFLSGGMDSSALVALMRRVTDKKPRTFSVIFDEKRFDEGPHSRSLAQHFQTEHQEIHLSDDQLFDLLPAALCSMDQPSTDGINSFVVSKAVKEAGITVALSGLGGDELFGGYSSFRRALRLAKIPRFSRSLLSSASSISRMRGAGSVRWNKFWDLAESEGDAADVYEISRRLFSSDHMIKLLGKESGVSANGKPNSNAVTNEARGVRADSRSSVDDADTFNRISALEMTRYMANTLLRDTDTMSMAHSLEVRVPFVDRDLVRLVLCLPGRWKVNGHTPKILLADAVSDLLPREILQRRKMGFTLPFEKWMQSRLRTEISSVLEHGVSSLNLGLDSVEVTKVWKSFLKLPRAVGWSRPWSLYVLAKWCETNRVTI